MVESLAYCSVCFDEYNQETRVPLMLSCGHTFCGGCLLQLPAPMKCPHCRVEEPKVLGELPKNILVYQIQAQLNPSATHMCVHADPYFYCKLCKYPLCVECVVEHSSHGLISLKDPELNELIDKHIAQIESSYKFRIDECRRRKTKAEEYKNQLDSDYEKNKQEIRDKFSQMRGIVEAQESFYLEHISSLYREMYQNNERTDNIHSTHRVDVKVDEDWLLSNLKKIGNIGVFNPNRQELCVRRARNVKALNWKYSGRIDALSFKVSNLLYLAGIGVCTPYKNDKQANIDEMKVIKGQGTRDEVCYLHSFPVEIHADFINGVQHIAFEALVELEPDVIYTLYLKLSGAKTFKCVDSQQIVEGRDSTRFHFFNTNFVKGDESNRTDVQCGPIADFYYMRTAVLT